MPSAGVITSQRPAWYKKRRMTVICLLIAPLARYDVSQELKDYLVCL